MRKEVIVLRSFAPERRRARAIRSLCAKYRSGRASASDVVLGMAACAAQCRRGEASTLFAECARAVRPVPLVLAEWACARAHLFDVDAWRRAVRAADPAWRAALRRAMREPAARAAVAIEADHRHRAWAGEELVAYLCQRAAYLCQTHHGNFPKE